MRTNSEDVRAFRDYQDYINVSKGHITYIPIYEQTGQGIRISQRARALSKVYQQRNTVIINLKKY